MRKEKFYSVDLESLIFGEFTLHVNVFFKEDNYYIQILNSINDFKQKFGPWELFSDAHTIALMLIKEISKTYKNYRANILSIAAPKISNLTEIKSCEPEVIEKHSEKYDSIIFGPHTIKSVIREYFEDNLYDIIITNSENEEELRLQYYSQNPNTRLTLIKRNYLAVNKYLNVLIRINKKGYTYDL